MAWQFDVMLRGAKTAIALDWSEEIELSPEPEKPKALVRPKAALSKAAKYIGINEQKELSSCVRLA